MMLWDLKQHDFTYAKKVKLQLSLTAKEKYPTVF